METAIGIFIGAVLVLGLIGLVYLVLLGEGMSR